MKQTTLYLMILFGLIDSHLCAQVKREFGLEIGSRNEGYQTHDGTYWSDLKEAMQTKGFNNHNLALHYRFGKKRFMFSSSLILTHAALTVEAHKSATSYWNHSAQSNHYEEFTQVDVSYTYLGIGLSPSFNVLTYKNFSFFTGPTIQLDFACAEKESNHRDSIVSSTSITNMYNPATGQVFNYHSSKSEISHQVFDGIELNRNFLSLGLNLRPRYEFERLSLEASILLGFNFAARYIAIQNSYYFQEKRSQLFCQFSLGAFYNIRSKSK